jgi:prepilin-type N-terminal cleavage/methylation domain-containing protein
MKTRGFTMVETLIAVLILALVVAASLTLVSLSERTLAGVREKESLLKAAAVIQLETAGDPLSKFGTSGDVEWTVEEKESEIGVERGIAAAALVFSGESAASGEIAGNVKRKWKELTVNMGGKSLVLILPPPSPEKINQFD